MMKIWKIILIAVVVVGFIGFLAVGYWYKTEGPAMAVDYNANTEIVCEEPIPVGIAIDTTVNFLDKIYQLYQGDEVKTASKAVDALMTAIASKDGKICDFNDPKKGCQAQVGTAGPDATVQLTSGIGVEALIGTEPIHYTYEVPSCKFKEATGNPCPDLSSYVGEQTPAEWAENPELLSLDGLAESLTAQADNIHGLFSVADTPVPYGLAKSGEDVGETMITKVDLVKRYIADIDSWLTPSPQKNTCALSELDRIRISQGKMGDKFPLQCMDALSKEMYTPKAWSEKCQDECETFSQECKNCLAKCEGKSVYASLNCKIYSTGSNKLCTPPVVVSGPASQQCCGQFCADGFNTQCKECLCQDLTQEQCLDWICGGSKANWVCCHEEPIKSPAYYDYMAINRHPELDESDQSCGVSCTIATQEAGGPGAGYTGQGEIFLLSAYGPNCFNEGQCTSQQTLAGQGVVAAYEVNIPANTKIRINAFSTAKEVKDVWTYKNVKDGFPVWEREVENTSAVEGTYCVCDVGGGIKDHRIDVFLPTFGHAKEFGMRFGEVEIIEKNSNCCGEKQYCCYGANLAKAECKVASGTPVSVICNKETLEKCSKDPQKDDYNYLNNTWCKEYKKANPTAQKFLDRALAFLMFWK